MNRKKILLMVLLTLILVLSVVCGVFWHMRHYVLIDMQFYPRDVQQLDLRDREISIRHYEKLLRRLPECEILWNVPFQQTYIPCDVTEITVSTLNQQDIRNLSYFNQLESVHAEGCGDYESLMKLWKQRPDLQVEYVVPLGAETYSPDVEQIVVNTITQEDLTRLAWLPNLKSVLCGGGEQEAISRLQEYCREAELEFSLVLGGQDIPLDTTSVTADGITEDQLGLLQFLPNLKQLHISLPKVPAEKLLELKQSRPDVTVTWEQEICGQVFDSSAQELDLSAVKITSLEELDQALAYFPDKKLVFLGECGLDNEALAAYREQVRDWYKLVWTVSCGSKLKIRTDATTFMPVREYVYYFNDEEAYNLRYCEDMVVIDIGHMSIHTIDFVEFMPNLEYLILAHTQLNYIEPIRHCKKLKFLELDWSPIRDLSPLKDCTALEDVNLGKIFADFAPIGEMTWLKNLWMVGCSSGARYRMTEALPNTKVMVTGAATVANGWRDLDNYYKMRDLLGMHYMSW